VRSRASKVAQATANARHVPRAGNLYAQPVNGYAFRCMKSPLAERPIFHHLEHRVESHIFLCVLAYHLLVAIETTLLRQEIHTSWATLRDLLATHKIATIVLPTDRDGVLGIRRSATPELDHRVLYEALGVPTEIIRPVKTWERNQLNSD